MSHSRQLRTTTNRTNNRHRQILLNSHSIRMTIQMLTTRTRRTQPLTRHQHSTRRTTIINNRITRPIARSLNMTKLQKPQLLSRTSLQIRKNSHIMLSLILLNRFMTLTLNHSRIRRLQPTRTLRHLRHIRRHQRIISISQPNMIRTRLLRRHTQRRRTLNILLPTLNRTPRRTPTQRHTLNQLTRIIRPPTKRRTHRSPHSQTSILQSQRLIIIRSRRRIKFQVRTTTIIRYLRNRTNNRHTITSSHSNPLQIPTTLHNSHRTRHHQSQNQQISSTRNIMNTFITNKGQHRPILLLSHLSPIAPSNRSLIQMTLITSIPSRLITKHLMRPIRNSNRFSRTRTNPRVTTKTPSKLSRMLTRFNHSLKRFHFKRTTRINQKISTNRPQVTLSISRHSQIRDTVIPSNSNPNGTEAKQSQNSQHHHRQTTQSNNTNKNKNTVINGTAYYSLYIISS